MEAPFDSGLRWWNHQHAWLNDRSRFRLCLKSRQIGMSTIVAAEAVGDAVAGKTTVLASASERQSRELMRRCRKILPIVTSASNGSIRTLTDSSDLLELSTGGRVLSVPASAATTQGYSGSVVLDEAAWMPNADELWQALVPSITASTEHRLSVLSTPRGKGGLFHRLWNSADKTHWSRHRVTVDEAIAGGCSVDRESLRAAVADEQVWRACYLCEFIDEQYSLLPYDLIEACADEDLPYHIDLSRLNPRGEYFAGFDVGRKHDLSVLAIVERKKDTFICRGFLEMSRTPFDEQERTLDGVLKRACMHRLCIDASGIGLQLSERMKNRYGSTVEPITLSMPVKEDLASRMLRVFQSGLISIPQDDTLAADLHSVEKQITAAGNVRYAAPRSEGSHADRFVALALALHGADQPTCDFDFYFLGSDRDLSSRSSIRALFGNDDDDDDEDRVGWRRAI